MIGQHLYYLNNKTYITNLTNLESVIFELNSFYHTKTPRNIMIVRPSDPDTNIMEGQYTELVRMQKREGLDLLTFRDWADVANIDFIQNSEKYIMIFSTEEDMIHVYCRYIAGLLKASNFYPTGDWDNMASEFVEKVLESDSMFTYMSASETIGDVSNYCNTVLDNNERFNAVYQNGKNFSYDLLFFLNDYYRCDAVQSLIVEKFTIHSAEMAQDVMEHFTSRRHYMAYILSVIDWMNANGYTVDKQDFVNRCYLQAANKGNYTVAFYQLEELWNQVKDDANFIARHQTLADSTPDGWEFMDIYTEFKNAFPIVKKVLEKTFDMDNLTEDLRLINTDVQFFSKRQNRIPYLIHKYTLTGQDIL